MPAIVEHTERTQPENRYPTRLVPPASASAGCAAGMQAVGLPEPDGQWIFEYRRGRTCGSPGTSHPIRRRWPCRT
jgi:hypothetical protein